LRPLLGLKRWNSQRNPDIQKKLKVNVLIEDVKLYQKSRLDILERMDRSHLLKLAFQYQLWGRRNGKTMKTLSFKGTGFKT
jgi:hypothetical protein